MATQQIERLQGLPGGCASDADIITPSDSEQTRFPRGFYISVAGVCKITTLAGTTLSPSLAVGYHPIALRKFWTTGTDSAVKAGTVMGLYD